jgi:hypothetical protein
MPSARRNAGFVHQRGTRASDNPRTTIRKLPIGPHFYGNRITPELRRGQQRMILAMALDAPWPD